MGIVLFYLAGCSFCFAQETSIPSLYRYRLENGLELYVMENDSAPLAYIEIAVRAGAVTQTAENAGLFHLYEHMMFKGNENYANQKEVTQAMNRLGVADWNGTTSVDRVNYFFTVPSYLVYDGLEFWSYAIRTPLMNETELENEKSVVLSEIQGGLSEPGHIVGAELFKNLFPQAPWRMDTSGDPDIIRNADVNQLRKIQGEYYVPQNAALFVGGDVQHEEIYKMVQQIYGSWQNGPDAKGGKEPVEVPEKSPSGLIKKIVYPDPRSSGKMVQVVYYLRGPDSETDQDDIYGADVWSYCLSNPESAFVSKAVAKEELCIPDADYIGGGYSTMRASGMISFSAAMVGSDTMSPVEQAEKMLAYWNGEAVEDMLKTGTGFDDSDISNVNKRLEDGRIYSLETAEGFLKGFSREWASSGADFYFNYDENLSKVTNEDVKKFVKKYIQNKKGIAVLFVNPEYYKQHKKEFVKTGWKELNSDNANWWKCK